MCAYCVCPPQSSESSNRCDIIAQFRAAYEERKRLHNELQELRGNVRVYCRARPIKSSIANCVTVGRVEDGNPGQVSLGVRFCAVLGCGCLSFIV